MESRSPIVLRDNETPGDLSRWLREQGGDNAERLGRLRRNMRRARDAELTPRQQQIVDLYYGRGYSIPKIAMELALNKSTVSRTLQRARGKLYRCLKYSL